MKALVATTYGEPEQLTIADLPVPRPGPGQIQVRIEASTFNPTDLRAVAGGFAALAPLAFPYTLGNDFAGTVTEAGPGVTLYRVGDAVFGQAMPHSLRFVADPERPSVSTGAMAEFAVFEADTPLLARRPVNVPAEQAAALGIAGMTAQALMSLGRIQPGESVLVVGATGTVGTTVLPLLAAAKARIVATAATEAGADVLRGLGAHEIVGYGAYPAEVDVVFNLVLFGDDLAPAARPLRPGGRLVSIIYPPPTPEQVGRNDVEVEFVMDVAGRLGGMRAVADAAAAGDLTALIAARYTLDEGVNAALDYAHGHPIGKIVVLPGGTMEV